MKIILEWLKRNEALVLLLVFLVLLRLPSLYEPAWYGDENIYLTIGQGVKKGLVLYRDITDFPNKPPLIYLLASVVGSVFWFRLLLLFWNGVNAVVMFKLLKELTPRRKWLWYGFTLVFILLTGLPLWEGNIANAEIFFILPTTLGFLLLWKGLKSKKSVQKRKRLRLSFWAGMAMSVGFLFKIPVVADIAAAGLFFFIFPLEFKARSVKKLVANRALHWFALGLVLPVIAAFGFHLAQGVTPIQLLGNATGSAGYVSVWQSQSGVTAHLSMGTLTSRVALTAIIILALFYSRKKVNEKVMLASLWLSLAIFGMLLSARPYPHYLLQAVPPLVLLMALAVSLKIKKRNLVVMGGMLFLSVMAYIRFGFETYPVAKYYQQFYKFVKGDIEVYDYYNQFDSRMRRNYQVAEYLRTRTNPREQIYIWGTEPGIYVISRRSPVGRLTTSFHVEDLNEYEVLMKEIEAVRPRYIVVMETEDREFSELMEFLSWQYTQVKNVDGALIYRLLPEVK